MRLKRKCSNKRIKKSSIKRRYKISSKRSKRRSKRSKRSIKKSRKKYNSIIDGMFDEESDKIITPPPIRRREFIFRPTPIVLDDELKVEYAKPISREGSEKFPKLIKREPYTLDAYKNSIDKEKDKDLFPGSLDMSNQKNISIEMLKKLIKWFQIFNEAYKFPRFYLYNTINYLKRYINKTPNIEIEYLQLIGVVCYGISFKNYNTSDLFYIRESGKSVNIFEFIVYITGNAYNIKQVSAMEENVLNTLKFNINIPIPEYFFDIYTDLIPLTLKENKKAKFLLEFPNYMFIESYVPSLIALAGILLTKKINYSELSDDIKEFIDLDKYEFDLLYKYIGYLKIFFNEKFDGDYENSYQNFFKEILI